MYSRETKEFNKWEGEVTKELIRVWEDQKVCGIEEFIHVCEEGVTKEFPSKYKT